MIAIETIGQVAEHYDIAVVGAGPAGLAAAARAAELGLSVLLADENPAPGGQIYRAITTTPVTKRAVLGEDYWKGGALVDRLRPTKTAYAPGCTVWSVAPDEAGGFELGLSLGGQARLIAAGQVILATGAQERPFPIPGWTLPGVMTAGAAQIALKASGLVPSGRTVIAGCGPCSICSPASSRRRARTSSPCSTPRRAATGSPPSPHFPISCARPISPRG